MDVRPGRRVPALKVSFEASMDLDQDDSINISLNWFSGADKSLLFATSREGTSMVWSVTWTQSSHLLVLRPNDLMARSTRVEMTLHTGGIVNNQPTIQGIFLVAPSDGTQRIHPEHVYTVEVMAAQRSLAPLPLRVSADLSSSSATIQRLPAMTDATFLHFVATTVTPAPPILAGGGTEMTFAFVPAMQFLKGDTISMHLPGFTAYGNGEFSI